MLICNPWQVSLDNGIFFFISSTASQNITSMTPSFNTYEKVSLIREGLLRVSCFSLAYTLKRVLVALARHIKLQLSEFYDRVHLSIVRILAEYLLNTC